MFATIMGLLLALAFIGLPLAIIILFVLSILDQTSEGANRIDRGVVSTERDGVVRHVQWGRREKRQNSSYLARSEAGASVRRRR